MPRIYVIAILFVLSIASCYVEYADYRVNSPGVSNLDQSMQKPIKIIKSFKATEQSQATSEFTPDYRITKQTIKFSRDSEQITKQFQQITRPEHRQDLVQGSLGTEIEEVFFQRNYGIIDILLVIDNSSSMAEEQHKLSTQLPNLLGKINQSDWHIAITTTDPKDGCLTKIIKKGDNNPEATFSNVILDIGVNGSGNESGFAQIANALNCSTSWLRSNSNLGILVVSDEDNCSDGSLCAGGYEDSAGIDYIREHLNQLRNLGEDARVYGIYWNPGDSTANCPSAFRPAYLYHELVRLSDGTSGSICDASYESTFHKISRDLFNTMKVQFPLTHQPLANTMVVTINGQLYEGTYQVHNKSIYFMEAPPENAVIKVNYRFGPNTLVNHVPLEVTPDIDTISINVNGTAFPTEDYMVQQRNLVFRKIPPENARISIIYKKFGDLPHKFHLEDSRELHDIRVLSNNGQSLQASYSAADTTLTFKRPPQDGQIFNVIYLAVGSPRLSYPIIEETKGSFFELRAEINEIGEEIPVYAEDGFFKFSLENFSENQAVEVSYRDFRDEVQQFTLPQQPVAGSLYVSTSNNTCTASQFILINNVIQTECSLSYDEIISASYNYVIKENKSFNFDGINNPDQAHWALFVDDKPFQDFIRKGHVITITKDLPETATIQVVVTTSI